MPPSEQAAQATDAYRLRLVQVRDSTATAVGDGLVAVSLDLAPTRLDRALRDWQASSAELVEGARLRAAQASHGYLTAYLGTVGAMAPTAEDPAAVDAAAKLLGARKALLYLLGRGDGRPAAQRYGRYVAERQARTLVAVAARDVLASGIRRSPQIVGWRRVTSTSTCDRCAKQSGHVYADHAPFASHDSCRCTAEPVIRGVPERLTRAAPTVVAP